MDIRKILLAVAVAAPSVTAGAAFAADLPQPYVAPPAAAVPTWEGLYIGLNGSYGWGGASASFANGDPGAIGVNPTGALVGGQIGYNWQFSQNFLLGIEASASAGSLFADWSGPGASGGTSSIYDQVTSLGSVRGRLGYTNGPWLTYIAGGWAWASNTRHSDGSAFGGYSFTESRTHSGWTAAIGAEYALTQHWSLRGELSYADLGTQNYDSGPSGGTDVHLTTTLATFGINYKF